jgi:hypothetical protein
MAKYSLDSEIRGARAIRRKDAERFRDDRKSIKSDRNVGSHKLDTCACGSRYVARPGEHSCGCDDPSLLALIAL